MSIWSVVKDVCLAVGVNPPTTLFGATVDPRTQAEMLSLANEMAQRIAYDVREWTALKQICTFTGDGIKDRFPLPANYRRMLVSSQVYPSWMPRQPLAFIADSDEWLVRRFSSITVAVGEYTLMGDDMLIWPILSAAQSVKFVYLDKNCIKLIAPDGVTVNGYGNAFQSDKDTTRIDERILKLGMIWQWKANKGSPYAEDMGTYTDALFMLAGSDKPAPIIRDPHPISADAQVALPWPASWGLPVS